MHDLDVMFLEFPIKLFENVAPERSFNIDAFDPNQHFKFTLSAAMLLKRICLGTFLTISSVPLIVSATSFFTRSRSDSMFPKVRGFNNNCCKRFTSESMIFRLMAKTRIHKSTEIKDSMFLNLVRLPGTLIREKMPREQELTLISMASATTCTKTARLILPKMFMKTEGILRIT